MKEDYDANVCCDTLLIPRYLPYNYEGIILVAPALSFAQKVLVRGLGPS